MLKIQIPEQRIWNEKTEEFVSHIKKTELQLEHSLISLTRWEEKWCIPFLGKEPKTEEQVLDYIRCMTINKDIDPLIYKYIPLDVQKQIMDYIDRPMTATWFSNNDENNKKPGKKEVITSEIIYYWMITLNIPIQFERWHLNKLMTLIKVINIKNMPPKKQSKKELLAQHAKLNAARRAKYNSKG